MGIFSRGFGKIRNPWSNYPKESADQKAEHREFRENTLVAAMHMRIYNMYPRSYFIRNASKYFHPKDFNYLHAIIRKGIREHDEKSN